MDVGAYLQVRMQQQALQRGLQASHPHRLVPFSPCTPNIISDGLMKPNNVFTSQISASSPITTLRNVRNVYQNGMKRSFPPEEGLQASAYASGEGSPPKRPGNAVNGNERSSDLRSCQYKPLPMAVQDIVQEEGQRPVNGHTHQNGVHTNGNASNGNGTTLPDVYVALYGCSGYGELAIKVNSGMATGSSVSSLGGNAAVNGGGSCGVADNQAYQLWDEDASLMLIAWAVVDAKTEKIVSVEERVLRPADEHADAQSILSQFSSDSGLNLHSVLKSPYTLDGVLQEIQGTVAHYSDRSKDVILVTLGPELLRQQLLPECSRRGIPLPDYFYSYVDLLGTADISSSSPSLSKRLADLLDNNRLGSDSAAEYGKRHVADMATLIQFMLHSGHHLYSDVQHVAQRYEPGLSNVEEVSDDVVVRARGLPWQASDMDVARFFFGLDIPRGGIALCLSSHGRRNGEAIVVFTNAQQRDLALQRHKQHMANRYIEVYRALAEDFQQVAGVCNTEAERFLKRKGELIVRMRGLPYEATPKEVVDFFADGDEPVNVVDAEEGVLFVKRADGRAAGDAFVLFRTEEDGQKALAKHRERIGSRYIELFRSTTAEVQQVLNKSQDMRSENQAPLISTPPMSGLMSPVAHGLVLPSSALLGRSGVRNCIRLRGLPFEATVEDILDFLGDKAGHIVMQGVHMVYNAQGQPSGEAFIQMDSETAANLTCQERHNRFMNMQKYNKKNRYIEVYQCSADEMNGSGSLGLPSFRPVIPHGLAGLTGFQPNFPFNPNLQLMMSQLSPGFRPQLSNLYPLPYWTYPSPPLSPTNGFSNGSVLSGLPGNSVAGLSNGVSFVHLRNLPYSASVGDVSAFLKGQISPESIQLNRQADGRQNGEAFVMFGSREEAERIIRECNRQNLGNRRVDMTLLA